MVKKNFMFIFKITLIHVLTYIVCGIIFSMFFKYQESLKVTEGFRDMNHIMVQLSPIFQIVRGILFGLVLLLIRQSFHGKKYDWLKLWLIIIVIGIFNTPATAPFSIEEFIYCEPSNMAWNLQLGGLAEILVQTLLFSFLSIRVIKHSS
ncbi:hypothetical protein [Clostridium isatidis]|uniref:Uncharacterized protein n=1 Tax=Clostridium isatidis TaxID=182773 RepID=A0A343JCC3_9CLOT|nr:hypothetical protein [Clostridium isatidis]ASW43181.1 hypothetical protein BEN51_06715 [Clostridium isatidis]NLZ34804.1 hypothetical protein [Clostridiales bacterium]